MRMRRKNAFAWLCAGMLLLSACGVVAADRDMVSKTENAAQPLAETTNSAGFSDVPADAWYAEAVDWCKEHGIMSGTSAAEFSPDRIMTRAMLATVLYRVAGSPAASGPAQFSDVAEGSWCLDAVAWAAGAIN